MFLSTLLIDTGTNPDRPRPGRLWLRNLYRVHQRLCMAFPSARRKQADRDFLLPYLPDDFPEDRFSADAKPDTEEKTPRAVHAQRDEKSGFLFRVDPLPGGRAVILVLSALEPDWPYAFHNAMHLLAAIPASPRPLELNIAAGQRFRFRLLANPTKRAALSKDQRQQKKAAGEKVKRPRHQLTWNSDEDPEEIFRNWLGNKADRAGFRLCEVAVGQIGYVYINKNRDGDQGQRLRSVRYEGVLEVTDANKLRQSLACGVGPAKAFGFGLLSLAPA